MQYRKLGKTGIKTSILGFGAMRLPTIEPGKEAIDHVEAIKIIRKAIDAGVTYIDTAEIYHDGESEIVVGKALKDGYREKVTLVTKIPLLKDEFTKAEQFEEYLELQMKRLDVEYLDICLLHALNEKSWKEKVLKLNLIERAKKAKKEGKFKHLGFSFHDKPEVLKEIIDSGEFEVMLVQYNILDTVNEEMIKYAAEKGLGVAIMGSVGGGRLAGEPAEELRELLTNGRKNFVDLALKFVWSHPHVSVALSGMGSEEMVDDNVALASSEKHTLSSIEEKERAAKIGQKFKELTDNICTGCGYCMPCPNEVNISFIFRMLMLYQIYGVKDKAKTYYSRIDEEDWPPGKSALACSECGECEPKCPQKIPIIEQLKKTHELLTS